MDFVVGCDHTKITRLQFLTFLLFHFLHTTYPNAIYDCEQAVLMHHKRSTHFREKSSTRRRLLIPSVASSITINWRVEVHSRDANEKSSEQSDPICTNLVRVVIKRSCRMMWSRWLMNKQTTNSAAQHASMKRTSCWKKKRLASG